MKNFYTTFIIFSLLWFFSCRSESGEEKDSDGCSTSPNPDIEGIQIFPGDNPWNTDISLSEVDINSVNLIKSIGLTGSLKAAFGTVWEDAPNGIPYVMVCGDQEKVQISFKYASESDPGPYPIPPNIPIEAGSDRHIIILDTANHLLYEVYNAQKNDKVWTGGSGAIFDLKSNKLRQDGWTSADAAGLPILPGLVRFDEVKTGLIDHAIRFTVNNTRNAFVHPATHGASSSNDPNLPPMGMRVRLKKNVDISKFSNSNQVILKALITYGMILADNGSNWYMTGAPDPRWNDEDLHELGKIKGSDFEVVKMDKIILQPK